MMVISLVVDGYGVLRFCRRGCNEYAGGVDLDADARADLDAGGAQPLPAEADVWGGFILAIDR